MTIPKSGIKRAADRSFYKAVKRQYLEFKRIIPSVLTIIDDTFTRVRLPFYYPREQDTSNYIKRHGETAADIFRNDLRQRIWPFAKEPWLWSFPFISFPPSFLVCQFFPPLFSLFSSSSLSLSFFSLVVSTIHRASSN